MKIQRFCTCNWVNQGQSVVRGLRRRFRLYRIRGRRFGWRFTCKLPWLAYEKVVVGFTATEGPSIMNVTLEEGRGQRRCESLLQGRGSRACFIIHMKHET